MTVKLFKFTAYAEEEFSPFHTKSFFTLNYLQVTKRSCVNRSQAQDLFKNPGKYILAIISFLWRWQKLLSSFSMFITVYGKYALDVHLWSLCLADFFTCHASLFIRAAAMVGELMDSKVISTSFWKIYFHSQTLHAGDNYMYSQRYDTLKIHMKQLVMRYIPITIQCDSISIQQCNGRNYWFYFFGSYRQQITN